MSSLTNKDISNKYTVTVGTKFNNLHEISERLSLNDKLENFVTAHRETRKECIPTKELNFESHWSHKLFGKTR